MGRRKGSKDFKLTLDLDSFPDNEIQRVTKREPVRKLRKIICWDGEGMNLSGPGKPQHYVLFGCSAETATPLVSQRLRTGELLEYILEIGQKYPGAVHLAYSFKYDVNMIVQNLTPRQKAELHVDNKTVIPHGFAELPSTWGYRYTVEYIPGKIFRVSRMDRKSLKGCSVRIYDVFSFFARAFLDAAESILKDELTDEDREVIGEGKKDRGKNLWPDIERVRQYWAAEIRIMERMCERFREVMYAAGLRLTAWYGPGAIASYLIKQNKLGDHIQNEPEIAAVHEASKTAYAGGRFELFQLGRFRGPVWGLDINSAYPWALSGAPSLGIAHGEWRHVVDPQRIEEFGVYRVAWRGSRNVFETRAMPLFHRDRTGAISFPGSCDGWYWSPEARVVWNLRKHFPDVHISEGWVWEHDGTRPFKFLEEMYQQRMTLGKDNIISMPYKLGPNSMYGKFAQQIGFREGKYGELSLPPESHCLPLAGWITSKCRAELYKLMVQIPPKDLIAVETDGIFTTFDPANIQHLQTGNYLGEWDVTEYDEMLYLRNGIYHKRRGNEWSKPKARGLDATSVGRIDVENYLRNFGPTEFPILKAKLKDRFIGLGAALSSGLERVDEKHCVWEPGSRDVVPGGNGKRIHIASRCVACAEGRNGYQAPHQLIIHSDAGMKSPLMSRAHTLLWETRNRTLAQSEASRLERLDRDRLQHPEY